MEPKTYRKTALIQAMYVDYDDNGFADAAGAWGARLTHNGEQFVTLGGRVIPGRYMLQTKEGPIQLHDDGVICRGPAGDFYCSDRTIFEANYEEVTPPAAE